MVASRAFTSQQISQLDVDAIAEVYDQYGINFANVSVDSDGSRTIPGVAVLKPAAYGVIPGKPSFITHDSENPNRKYKWVQEQYSTIVEFKSDLIVAAGFVQAGARVTGGSVYFRGYLLHGKQNKDWSKPKFCEVFTLSCTHLTAQSKNMWGEQEIAATQVIFDSEGKEGSGLATITKVHLPAVATGIAHAEGRTVLTWIKTAE